jgi:hypothetical protein
MSRKLALNVVVGLAGFLVFLRAVAVPLYRLLRLGVKPHGSLAEDPDFYYGLMAHGLITLGGALGITFALLGMVAALSTPLGFAVSPEERMKARAWFWLAPAFFFSLEIVGHFQVQRWYAEHGVLFPWTSFLREFGPHVWWLLGVWLLTAPAILTGRGLYHFLLRPEPAPAEPPE